MLQYISQYLSGFRLQCLVALLVVVAALPGVLYRDTNDCWGSYRPCRLGVGAFARFLIALFACNLPGPRYLAVTVLIAIQFINEQKDDAIIGGIAYISGALFHTYSVRQLQKEITAANQAKMDKKKKQ